MHNKRILIIQAGSPPDEILRAFGDYPLWFCNTLGLTIDDVEIVQVFNGEILPPPDPARVAVITGSWAMVTDRLTWSENTAQWIRDAMAVNMPLLGVCYGHQLMAHALGGYVDDHPAGREIGCQQIRLTEAAATDPLLTNLPGQFPAHLTHSQSVIRLPANGRVLASSDHDPYQIVRYSQQAVSVQFHPEFSAEICAAIVQYHTHHQHQAGEDIHRLLTQIKATPEAATILTRFIDQALNSPVAERATAEDDAHFH